MTAAVSEYRYSSAGSCHGHDYLLPVALPLIEAALSGSDRRVFDLGCGNGSLAAAISARGVAVTGVDPSQSGIDAARIAFPRLRLEVGSGYDNLSARFGTFPLVTCFEVIEHVYDPRAFSRTIRSLVAPGGTAIISTPFHGYWKNLAIAIAGRFDAHLDPLWDHGHIKFWSDASLRRLLEETGFSQMRFVRAGRFAPFAKSTVVVARR